MNRKALVTTLVLMAAALTGILATSPLAYAESDCENSVESLALCLRNLIGTSFIEDETADGETMGGEFLASDASSAEERAFEAAAPQKRYQVWVTLTDVPAGAEDLVMNVTIIRQPFFSIVSNIVIETVTSPSEGELVKFSNLRVPAASNENAVLVCGNTIDLTVSDCEDYPLPSKGGGPIRVDFPYPS